MFMDVCVYPSILLEQETRSGVHSIAEGGVWSQQECWMVEYYRGGDRCDTTLHYSTLHYTTLHYTTLHYTTLHYTTLHCIQVMGASGALCISSAELRATSSGFIAKPLTIQKHLIYRHTGSPRGVGTNL